MHLLQDCMSAQWKLGLACTSAQSYQDLRCPSEKRIGSFATIIALCGCAGWFESSLSAHAIFWRSAAPRRINEPAYDKTYKMACASSEDSDQPGHPSSLITVFATRMKKAWVLSYLFRANEDSDQTGRMPRLIWVFAGRTSHFVGFVMRWLSLKMLPPPKSVSRKPLSDEPYHISIFVHP